MRLLGTLGAKPATSTTTTNKYDPLKTTDDDDKNNETSIPVPIEAFIRPQTARQQRRIKEHMKAKAKANIICLPEC